MMHFMTLIGWLAIIAGCCWLSLFVYFVTVPTFGEALFSGSTLKKIGGVVLWVVLICTWVWALSLINFNFAIQVTN